MLRNLQGQLDGISNAFKKPDSESSDDTLCSQLGAEADELSSSGGSSSE